MGNYQMGKVKKKIDGRGGTEEDKVCKGFGNGYKMVIFYYEFF